MVREGLNGHGVVVHRPGLAAQSRFPTDLPQFGYDMKRASQLLSAATLGDHRRPRFTCLVRRDAEIERIALIVKRQLQQVGIEMSIEEVPVDQMVASNQERPSTTRS